MLICGIDEAGRGPLAGPVVASSVVFNENYQIDGVKDSKKLNENKREEFYDIILKECIDYKIIHIDNEIIDEINILQATMQAFRTAILSLTVKPDLYLIDGNYFKFEDNFQKQIKYETIIKGDEKIFAISCASIIAKVTRDRIMRKYHENFPEYNFFSHKGYATNEHIENIKKFGLCKIHRKSFCKNILIDESNEMHL